MPQTDIAQATASDLTNAMTDYSVDSETTDGPTEGKETTWINQNWNQYLGYYKKIPELRAVIDAKSTWTVGKGFKADEVTTMLLDTIKGNGVDTFNTILENLIRTMHIGGDGFAEVIRDDEENLINLKPLDPSTIKIVANRKGIIIRYEQVSKTKTPNKKFKPEEVLHLARNRVADEIHGVSLIDSLEQVILMKNEAMDDYKKVLHRNVAPMMIFHLDTDDTTEIASFKSKRDAAKGDGEDIYVPKDAVVPELLSLAPNATMNPLAWIQYLDNLFYEIATVPKIILGGSGEFTEASAKIAYLAFQQNVEEDQLYIEEESLSQLNILFELDFPASLENEMLSDQKKDGPENIDASEMTAGEGQ